MDDLDKEQFVLGNYLQSLLNAPQVASSVPKGTKRKVLSFRAGKFRCAVEYRHLAGIMPASGVTTWPTEAPPWLIGYLAETVQQTKLIDLLGLVRSTPVFSALAGKQFILLNQGSFALLVDQVEGAASIYDEQVTWQTEDGQRRWLAGIEQGTGLLLLNVSQMESMLPK
ncbi:MAG: chemotaxis protein CheW [Gammaproteobacteria bacterium]|nr:chemotaxis protein CheW [Gammaproteobacteria bacterium]